jgi:uncharacterized protein YdeI (YjbR/CyaY-like superfamily)
MSVEEIESFYPGTKEDWFEWLKHNHQSKQAFWLILYKKNSGVPTISWSDAVDGALCFGWVDSVRKSIDEQSFKQFVGKRKPQSTWSKINKDKVEQLIKKGLMSEAGHHSIVTAKKNGSWTILDEVEALILPEDLLSELNSQLGSIDFFLSLSNSKRKAMLQWIILAKRPETREKRIKEIVELASQRLTPKQF